MIETTKDSYYDALQSSSLGWHENNNDYAYAYYNRTHIKRNPGYLPPALYRSVPDYVKA